MGYRMQRVLRGLSIVSLLVSAGSTVAAMNWRSTWRSLAWLDAVQDPPTTSVFAVEAQATFQQWVVVALAGLVIPLACCLLLTGVRVSREAPQLAVGRRQASPAEH